MELNANPSFKEFGSKEDVWTQGFRTDLMKFHQAVNVGVAEEQLGALFPQIVKRYPGYMNKCLIKANRILPSPSPPPEQKVLVEEPTTKRDKRIILLEKRKAILESHRTA